MISFYEPEAVREIQLVLEYCTLTLRDLLDQYVLANKHIKLCMSMLLCGVAYMHDQGVIHRDLSPSNVLLDESGMVKIADFGYAWTGAEDTAEEPQGHMNHEVGTRYYRAPELLFSAASYTVAVDLWSIGCVLAEFFTEPMGSVLFRGETDIDQMCRIFRTLGVPDETSWPDVVDFPDYGKLSFDIRPSRGLGTEQIPNASGEAIDLIDKFLRYPSKLRLTAREALNHPFLNGMPREERLLLSEMEKQPLRTHIPEQVYLGPRPLLTDDELEDLDLEDFM